MFKFKKIILATLVIAATLVIVATLFASAQEEVQKTFKLKFSNPGPPGQNVVSVLYDFKEDLAKSTDGRIEVEIFHSGSLFTQAETLPALLRGYLDFAYTTAAWLSDYFPEFSMFSAGYLFKDYEHMSKVMNGEIGEELFNKVVEKLGIRPLACFYFGARQVNLRDIGVEVRTPEDLKGVKLRMPSSSAWLFLGEALGANPTPLSFKEIYLALKTGTIDGQDNPLPTIKTLKFYEVTKYISLTHHVIDTMWFCVNEKKWQEMDSELQEKIYVAINKARRKNDELTLKEESELVSFFEDQGLIIIEPDIEAFKTYVQKKYLDNEELTASWDMDLYEKIQAVGD